jgi:hypothetical protein
MCRQCAPPYERTPERREHMSEVTSGKPKTWLRGRQRPEHSQTMKDWWTPERRADASVTRKQADAVEPHSPVIAQHPPDLAEHGHHLGHVGVGRLLEADLRVCASSATLAADVAICDCTALSIRSAVERPDRTKRAILQIGGCDRTPRRRLPTSLCRNPAARNTAGS